MLVDATAELGFVNKLFEQSGNLEADAGVESVRKDAEQRYAQAVGQYEVIYKQFPDSERAPEAKYRIGMIQWKQEKNAKAAKNSFAMLMSDYPKSKWSEEARLAYEKIDQDLLLAREQADKMMTIYEEDQKYKKSLKKNF